MQTQKTQQIQVKAFGKSMPISTKHAMAICKAIKGMQVDKAIEFLDQVSQLKQAVKMKGEIPHRKGKGFGGGRYPTKASKHIIKIIKNLKGNAVAKNLDPDATVIKIAKADKAARPPKLGRFSRSSKNTHILLTAEENKSINSRTEFEKKKAKKETGKTDKAEKMEDNKEAKKQEKKEVKEESKKEELEKELEEERKAEDKND